MKVALLFFLSISLVYANKNERNKDKHSEILQKNIADSTYYNSDQYLSNEAKKRESIERSPASIKKNKVIKLIEESENIAPESL